MAVSAGGVRTHLVVDGSNLLHRALHVPSVQTLRDSEGRGTGGPYTFLQSLHKALEMHDVTGRCVVVWDEGHSQRRVDLFPSYKGRRSYGEPSQVPAPEDVFPYAEEYFAQKDVLNAALYALGIPILSLRGREADDLIFQTIRVLSRQVGDEIIVMSEDKDFLQLVDEHVWVWRPITDATWTLSAIRDAFGFDPEYYVFYKAILGDPSDNIEGVKGAGDVTAKKLVSRMEEPTLDALHDVLDTVTLKREIAVRDGMILVARNLKLVDLKQESFEPEEIEDIVRRIETRPALNFKHFLWWLARYEVESIASYVATWITPFRRLS